jgi:hypothetical protein
VTADEQIEQTLRDLGAMRRWLNGHGLDGSLYGTRVIISCLSNHAEYDRIVALFDAAGQYHGQPGGLSFDEYPDEFNYQGAARMASATLEFGTARVSVTKSWLTELPFDADAPVSAGAVVSAARPRAEDARTDVL